MQVPCFRNNKSKSPGRDDRCLASLAFGSSHLGGATFGRADGTVEFVSETVDGVVYEAMGTKANGEVESLN